MRFVYFILFIFGCHLLAAQSPDSLNQGEPLESIAIDSLNKKEKKAILGGLFDWRTNYPNPKKAVRLSAILPGAGQIYNKKYWKLPIVYGGLGAMVYFISFNTTEQKRFEKAYTYRTDGDDGTIDEFTINGVERLDEQSMLDYRKQHRKQKEFSYIGLALVYILVGVDSYVDAHLLNFDVNDDLTLKVRPDFKVLPDHNTSIGLGIGLHLNDNREKELPVQIYNLR